MKTKSKKLTVDKAISNYYNRHKDKLNQVYGSEKSAKAHLKYDTPDMPPNYFENYNSAKEAFDLTVEYKIDPIRAELKEAKMKAINKDIWKSQRQLNNRINPDAFQSFNTSLGSLDINGMEYDAETLGYYEIKNSDQVLAQVRVSLNGRSPWEIWQYIDREAVGI